MLGLIFMDERVAQRLKDWLNRARQGYVVQMICVCALSPGLWAKPLSAEGAQSAPALSRPSVAHGQPSGLQSVATFKNDQTLARSPSQESGPAQPKDQPHRCEESRPKAEDRAQKHEGASQPLSSLILTVKLALLADPELLPYEIEVEAISDNITLSGNVPSEMVKAAAAKTACAVPLVNSVANGLEVDKTLPNVLAHKQDEVITLYVKERFAKSATIAAANFDVKTEQGVVSLGGTVKYQVIVLEAAEAARQVPGVRAVMTDKVRIGGKE